MVNFAVFARNHWVNLLVPAGFLIGMYLDNLLDNELSGHRFKSALYSKELKPGEKE